MPHPSESASYTHARLAVVQTELSPATLWHSDESALRLFANLGVSGLGGPTFLAYSSPTGIAVARPGASFSGAEMRENWLLVGFPGAEGWREWDSPWAAFLQRRPERVGLTTNGLELSFQGPARHLALMPIYGYYKPPQKDREFLSRHGLEEKDLKTWEWATVVARDPLVRLRYWAGATRWFPTRCEDTIVVDRGRDTVILRQRFEGMEIPDEWGTRPIRVAPVSPTLGLAVASGGALPFEFSRKPFDFELPTPYGPYFGVPNADDYEVRFPVLRYIHETEAAAAVDPGSPAVVRQALERLRAVARVKFPSPDRSLHDPGDLENFGWAIQGDQWYAKALPYYDEPTRTAAMASLGRYLREEVLVRDRYREREFPPGSGRSYLILEGPGTGSWGELGDAGRLGANVLQTVWAYAHFTGDHALVRDRWPLIRRLFTTAAETRWAGFGRDRIAELGDQAAPVVAFARLAYLAGDLDAYHFACGIFARELVHHLVKQRGARWFRTHQPWHSMEPIDEEVFLTHLRDDLAGWQFDGPSYPRETGERQSANRWVRFQDLDVARFYRDYLRAEVAREFSRLPPEGDPRRHTDESHRRPSIVRLHSFLLNASATNLAAIATPDQFRGPPSGVIASCLAVIRSARPPRFERLIPGGPRAEPVLGLERDVPGPHPHLVQGIAGPRDGVAGWPRITWWGWKTPAGDRWHFGEVIAGSNAPPARLETRRLSWNAVVAFAP